MHSSQNGSSTPFSEWQVFSQLSAQHLDGGHGLLCMSVFIVMIGMFGLLIGR